MLASERLLWIEQALETQKVLNLREVSKKLGASESTIRRDFDELEEKGILTRVYGGVMRTKKGATLNDRKEPAMEQKRGLNTEGKRTICVQAAQMVKDGDCVFIDGGTTMKELFWLLCQKEIKIVTHNCLFVNEIAESKADIIMIGGRYLPRYGMNVGPVAQESLSKFQFDYAFIGCAAIDLQGKAASTADLESAAIKQLAMQQAIASYLLCDIEKTKLRGFYEFKALEEFDAIFMNAYPEDAEPLTNVVVCADTTI